MTYRLRNYHRRHTKCTRIGTEQPAKKGTVSSIVSLIRIPTKISLYAHAWKAGDFVQRKVSESGRSSQKDRVVLTNIHGNTQDGLSVPTTAAVATDEMT